VPAECHGLRSSPDPALPPISTGVTHGVDDCLCPTSYCAALQQSLNTANLRLSQPADTVGARTGRALKNVWRSPCVPQSGPVWAEKRRAAVMNPRLLPDAAASRGHQPCRSRERWGAFRLWRSDTDLYHRPSRVTTFGCLPWAGGEPFDSATTVRGAATARAVDSLAQDNGLDLAYHRRRCRSGRETAWRCGSAMKALLTPPLKGRITCWFALIAKSTRSWALALLRKTAPPVDYLKSTGCVAQVRPLLDDTGDMIGSLVFWNVQE